MKKIIFILLFFPFVSFGQDFTNYFTGNSTDAVTSPLGGICLMGGSTEDDNAMRWFLQKAAGGDILVLRTSGSDGYNDYFYTDLGIPINSVETIVCNNANASTDPYLLDKIQKAEGIWFAGGDQWNYVSYWRNSPVDSLINQAIQERKIVIGGTSAGMAIQGKYYFSAQNGTVTSSTALANPYNSLITVDSTTFIQNQYLNDVITDTHFDDPDRKGRLVTFLSRIITDYGVLGKAIACDEYVAVCIDANGIASVYGEHPDYDDNAYFIQPNCELNNPLPENCTPGNPLTWNLGGEALKVYHIKGTTTGNNTFDLNNWENGVGGVWENWYVIDGSLNEQSGNQIDCNPMTHVIDKPTVEFNIFPNPTSERITIVSNRLNTLPLEAKLFTMTGQEIITQRKEIADNEFEMILSKVKKGIYLLTISENGVVRHVEKITVH